GRIVTAAALLFCVAVGAFATSQIVFLKQLGIGTALAVLIDATIVRALLVPALMALLGDRNWWAPRPLARLQTASHSATTRHPHNRTKQGCTANDLSLTAGSRDATTSCTSTSSCRDERDRAMKSSPAAGQTS
ncbi:MAG: MMPL family transporter, partial [Chloroflexota bacterium]|nr:MMPL family transporter [Chloroflexota bacterium]